MLGASKEVVTDEVSKVLSFSEIREGMDKGW